MQPAAPVAGATGMCERHDPVSAVVRERGRDPPVSGSQVPGMNEPAGAAPVTGVAPRPSSLQQLLALKNRVLMIGIGARAAGRAGGDTCAQ